MNVLLNHWIKIVLFHEKNTESRANIVNFVSNPPIKGKEDGRESI